MKISALRLYNVKRFAGRGVAIEGIGDGVNVLCAANEFGKSTSFEALHALFFQPHSSSSGDVRNLRPYSGGSPLIEAEIATAEGRFRITKQFYSGRSAQVTDLDSGRLVAQADEAENFIAGLVRGGTAGPAGLLWVRQGVTGIEKRPKAEEDSEKQVRASLLESVQGEVEAVTGGRRMAEIMATVVDELDKLVTKKGPKAGGRYAAAIQERDRLAADEERLRAEVAALRQALDRRAIAMKRLAELDTPEHRQERRKAIEAAQAAFDAAKAQGEMLKTAEAELKLVRERRDGADRNLKAFRHALQVAGELRKEIQAAERRRSDALALRHEIADAIGTATADAEAAEAKEEADRKLLERLDAALKAREAWERLAELREQLHQAEAARDALEAAEAELALTKIPPGAIGELQALEVELATLRAIEHAARPSVTVDYDGVSARLVTMDGVPLNGGEQRTYEGRARLAVPGIGTITLHSNQPPKNDDRLEQAERKRRTLLASMGVEDLAAAQERQLRSQQLEADIRELRARLPLLAPKGIPTLRAEIAGLEAIDLAALEVKEDPAQVRSSLADAEERRKAARQLLREAEPRRASAEAALVQTEATLAKLHAELTPAEATLGPDAQRKEREQELASTQEDLERQLAAAQAKVEQLRESAADLDLAEAKFDRARSVEAAAEKEIASLRESIAGWNAEIRTRSDEAVEETWRETAEAFSAASARVAAFEKEVAVLQRLRSALESARAEARELYLKPVMTDLKPLLGLLFDDVAITFDDKTLLPNKIRRNGQEEEVERLSGGMREQLSVLTRLAFARLLARNGRPAPVILDDALVYSDDDRIERMFDALHRQSRNQQIIVFSCRQRAFQKLGGKVLDLTEWHP